MRLPGPHRPDPVRSLLGFDVGGVRYAIDIGVVRQIVNPLDLVPLPHAPRAVCGVASYRGEVVAVVDLRVRFGADPTVGRQTKWVVVSAGARGVAIVVDRVTDVFGVARADLRDAPVLGGGEEDRGISAVAERAGSLVFVLDSTSFDRLVAPLGEAGLIGPGAAPARAPSGAREVAR